jgi:hypothetical protein
MADKFLLSRRTRCLANLADPDPDPGHGHGHGHGSPSPAQGTAVTGGGQVAP